MILVTACDSRSKLSTISPEGAKWHFACTNQSVNKCIDGDNIIRCGSKVVDMFHSFVIWTEIPNRCRLCDIVLNARMFRISVKSVLMKFPCLSRVLSGTQQWNEEAGGWSRPDDFQNSFSHRHHVFLTHWNFVFVFLFCCSSTIQVVILSASLHFINVCQALLIPFSCYTHTHIFEQISFVISNCRLTIYLWCAMNAMSIVQFFNLLVLLIYIIAITELSKLSKSNTAQCMLHCSTNSSI